MNKILNRFKEYLKLKEIKSKEVCKCHNISSHDIKDAIENGCTGIRDVRATTKAGTACGKCNSTVEWHVYKAQKK